MVSKRLVVALIKLKIIHYINTVTFFYSIYQIYYELCILLLVLTSIYCIAYGKIINHAILAILVYHLQKFKYVCVQGLLKNIKFLYEKNYKY